jgi:hypothetical protein
VFKTINGLAITKWSPGLLAFEKTADLWKRHSMLAGQASPGTKLKASDYDILAMVDSFVEHSYSDARDRIYAMYDLAVNIALVSRKHLLRENVDAWRNCIYMDVDYSLDLRNTFESFALACLENNMVARLLEAASVRQRTPPSDDWPSWFPDWRLTPQSPLRLGKEPFDQVNPDISYRGEKSGNALGLRIKVIRVPPELNPEDYLSRVTMRGKDDPGSSVGDYVCLAGTLCLETRPLRRNTPECSIGDESRCIFFIFDRLFSFKRSERTKIKDAIHELNPSGFRRQDGMDDIDVHELSQFSRNGRCVGIH